MSKPQNIMIGLSSDFILFEIKTNLKFVYLVQTSGPTMVVVVSIKKFYSQHNCMLKTRLKLKF